MKSSGSRASLLWCGLAFLSLQLLLSGLFEASPGLRDALFQEKLARCEKVWREADPTALKLMFLGSSRTLHGFPAGEFRTMNVGRSNAGQSHAQPVAAFNFGTRGHGPVGVLLNLRRVLNAGVRPDLVLIEVMPPWLSPHVLELSPDRLSPGSLSFGEARFIERRASSSTAFWGEWVWCRLFPWVAQRCRVLSLVDRNLLLEKERIEFIGVDEYGFDSLQESYPPSVLAARKGSMDKEYRWLLQNFQLGELQCGALRETLQLCQAEKLPCMLVYAPEGPAISSLYPPPVRASIDRFVTGLSHDFSVPVIDARNWLPEECFLDSHHAVRPGAMRYVQRLQSAVGERWPLVAPKLSPPGLAANPVDNPRR